MLNLIFNFVRFFFSVCMCVCCLHVCICTTSVQCLGKPEDGALTHLALELHVIVSHHMGAGS